MGIFTRKFERDSFEIDDSHLHTPETAISQPASSTPSHQANLGQGSAKRRHGYSIEDAIKLMRDLPKDQRQMVVTIVQKTLSSANINVNDIIEDAGRKLSRLDTRQRQLNKEIEELEAGIAHRRQEIQVISHDSQETQLVKASFEEALVRKDVPSADVPNAIPVPPPLESEIAVHSIKTANKSSMHQGEIAAKKAATTSVAS
ncbi:MAG: hypothetical protein ACOH5I_18910 [Oligoflexus sp.]